MRAFISPRHLFSSGKDPNPRPDHDRAWWPWTASEDDNSRADPEAVTVNLDALTRRVTLRGELAGGAATKLERVLVFLLAIRPGDSTIDMSAITALDVAGVQCLTGFRSRLAELGATLTVTGAPVTTHRVLRLAGFDNMAP